MAAITLLPEALRDNTLSPTVDIAAGNPAHVRVAMISSVYGADPTLTFALFVEQSFDGGVIFEPWFGSESTGGTAGQPAKDGGISDGLSVQVTSFDGIARTIRATVTVNTPF